MLLFFIAALARAWALDLNLDCGCFGQGSSRIGPWPMTRNLLLIALLAISARWERWGMVTASTASTAPDQGSRR
jgi:hypothetical protein